MRFRHRPLGVSESVCFGRSLVTFSCVRREGGFWYEGHPGFGARLGRTDSLKL